jgi:ELWxxDGT repeat protein
MNIRLTLVSAFIFILSCKNLLAQATVLQNYPGLTTQQGNPKEFTEYNGYLYFSAASDETGRELWRTDGTAAGTKLFLDIGEYTEAGDPRYLTLFNSFIYFVADNGVDGNQLWKTDGTSEGTVMVTNLPGADPENLIVYNGLLIFTNEAASTGRELWKSDGTPAGTVMIKDIYPGTGSSSVGSGSTTFSGFVLLNGKCYFFCNDGSHGNELWESDGTTAGTVLVTDIFPGSSGSFSSTRPPVVLNGELYFPATNPVSGEELWKSNGTATGTQMVSDIRSGTSSSDPAWLTVMGNTIYFSANDGVVSRELWKTDGTASGTVLVKDILVGTNGTGPENLFNANGTLYFSSSSTSGIELFKSDGTTAGTLLVKDIYTGAPSSEPKNFALFNSLVYFRAASLNNGSELWRTDGTSTGTILVKEIGAGIGGGAPNNFKVFANKLLFVANEYGLLNMELWSTDGTTIGTVQLRDIYRGDDGSEITESIVYNDRLFSAAMSLTNGRELFKSDGTPGGTGLFMDIYAGANYHSSPRNFIQMGSNLYFFAQNSSNSFPKLHRTNGTVAGTTAVSGLHDVLRLQFVIGSNIYFFVNDSPGDRLYRNDGFSASVQVTQLNSGSGMGVVDDKPNNSILINNVFYFVAGDSDFFGDELWRTDGTSAGTYMVKNIAASFNSSDPRDFVNLNGTLYFTANDNINGRELWKSDGTTAGTVMLKDIYPGATSSNPEELIVSNGKIYFSALHPSTGRELWVSDGTTAGTMLSDDIQPGPESSNPRHLTNGSDRIWFSANTQLSGRELWQKTNNWISELVADIFPGPPSSNPASLEVIDLELYFGATNGINGAEPYKTLGSACSTVSLGDLSAGDLGSYPEFIGKVNNKILILATTPFYGRELMSLDGASLQIAANVNACQYYVWNLTGDTLENSGMYTAITQDQSGCDSLAQINLTIHNPVTAIDYQTACDSLVWIDGNTYYASTNIPTFVLQSAGGCDSAVTLNLTIVHSTSGTDIQEFCDSYTWIDGNTYTSSTNTPTFVLQNAAGCDSIVTLNLTITYSTSGTDIQTACNSYTWINGITYTSSTNTPTFVLQNATGCDSIVTLNLTILSNSAADVQTACNSYTWINGITYTSSTNTPTFVLQNAAGCDSTVNLNLTILSDNVIDVQTACDSYDWIDGNTYTSSTNTPTFVLQNAAGCDSTVTLNLTITHSNSGTDVQTACDSYDWIDGNTYTSSTNTPTFVLQNAAGCDSVVTLNLTITHSNSGTDVQTACDSYDWIDGNTYTSSTNTPTFVLQNAAGCDSVVTLNLTITHSNSGTDVQTACDSYDWIDGNTYTSSTNTPTFVLQNAAGCDSVVTLNLTITHSNSVTDVQTACDSYDWIDGNTYTSSTNTPTFVLQNAAGCDSIVTLDLTIIPSLPLTVENVFVFPSDATNCTGEASIDLSGNALFELDFDNGSQVVTSNGYSLVTNLCPGVHDLHVTDNCGDTLSVPVIIPVDSNYVFSNPFIDSLAIDSLGATVTNCDIYYGGIDTAYIDSIWANGNTVNVIWNIVDSNGSNLDTTFYALNNGNGVYWLQLSVFCPFKSVGEYFTVTEAIYFSNGHVSTAGLTDLKNKLFVIYPNPTNDRIHINFSGSDAELTVYDAQGKMVLKDQIQNQAIISLQNLERGVYLFDFKNSDGHTFQRVVKH